MASIPYSATDHALYITTYDDITFALQGEPNADFINIEFVNDQVTSSEGAKGDVQDSIRKAEMARITASCQWGSDFNKIMNQLNEDQKNGNYAKRAEVKRISNTENTTIFTSINPKVVKLPNWTVGTEAADRAYILNVHNGVMNEKQAPA